MSNIPHDIIIIILSTLPVQGVFKFRCVSKSWCSLLTDRDFIMKHIFKCSRVIMQCKDPKYNIKSFPLHPILNEPSSSIEVVEHDHPRKELRGLVEIVGSCNGLVLININKNLIYLWNPTTGESKRLPYSGFQLRSGSDIKYGFGYDKSSHDYKVVAIFKHSYYSQSCEGKVKVYSLKSNSWKALEPYPYGRMYSNGLFVDDGVALVWPSYSTKLDIAAYDLSTETYQKLPQPDLDDKSRIELGVLGGSLCLKAMYLGNPDRIWQVIKVDIWVMKKYGVAESWTKVSTIPYGNALLMLKSDQVLVACGRKFFLYNNTENTSRNLVIENLVSQEKSFVYIESLVSPNCFD